MKVEVDVLGSPVPNKPTVSAVDVKQHFNFLSKPYGLCGRKATLNLKSQSSEAV